MASLKRRNDEATDESRHESDISISTCDLLHTQRECADASKSERIKL